MNPQSRATLFIVLLLFFGTFATYASFMQRPENANVATRMFLSISLLESHTVEITRYGHLTEDRAEVGDADLLRQGAGRKPAGGAVPGAHLGPDRCIGVGPR